MLANSSALDMFRLPVFKRSPVVVFVSDVTTSRQSRAHVTSVFWN